MKDPFRMIRLHELVEIVLADGTRLFGEVVGKTSKWVAICGGDSNEPWSISRSAIAAFRPQFDG